MSYHIKLICNETTAKTFLYLYVYMWCRRAWSWMHRIWAIHLRLCAWAAQRKCRATSAQVQIFYYSLVRCRTMNTDCIEYRLCTSLDGTRYFCASGLFIFWCCLEMGLDYCPPSQYLLPVLEHDEGKQEVDCVDGEEMAWQVSLHYLLVISYSA